jgi:hypothetical protein
MQKRLFVVLCCAEDAGWAMLQLGWSEARDDERVLRMGALMAGDGRYVERREKAWVDDPHKGKKEKSDGTLNLAA